MGGGGDNFIMKKLRLKTHFSLYSYPAKYSLLKLQLMILSVLEQQKWYKQKDPKVSSFKMGKRERFL